MVCGVMCDVLLCGESQYGELDNGILEPWLVSIDLCLS